MECRYAEYLPKKFSAMKNIQPPSPNWNDLVFENRNKKFGAYNLRVTYHYRLLTSLLLGIMFILVLFLLPRIISHYKNSNDETDWLRTRCRGRESTRSFTTLETRTVSIETGENENGFACQFQSHSIINLISPFRLT